MSLQVGGMLAFCLVLISTGCSRTQSPDQALNASLASQGQSKTAVYPLAGKVTIDGQPPQSFKTSRSRLVIMLYDPSQPNLRIGQRPHETVNSEGNFAFHAYDRADGVPPGKYIVTFALLNFTTKRGYLGPDQLKNEYNDPDRNQNVPELNIDHQTPGKKNYEFDLKVPSGDPLPAGPKALTEIRSR
jgi:hypothetical protein